MLMTDNTLMCPQKPTLQRRGDSIAVEYPDILHLVSTGVKASH